MLKYTNNTIVVYKKYISKQYYNIITIICRLITNLKKNAKITIISKKVGNIVEP